LQFEARGDFDFPRPPFEPTRKASSVFLDFSRGNKNSDEFWQTARPMRIRTALHISAAKRIYRSYSNATIIKPGVP
jgi:hypothetical protein